MNLFELIENNRRMTAGLAAQSASAARAAPDIIGRAVEAQMLTGVAPSTVVQDPGGFQRLYQEQRNAGALLAGPPAAKAKTVQRGLAPVFPGLKCQPSEPTG